MELERCWGVAEDGAVAEVALVPSLMEELDTRWPPLGLTRRSCATGPIEARLGLSDEGMVVPDREPSGSSPPQDAWDLLEQTLTLFAVKRLTRLVAVHSALIAWNGKGLMVPASSGAGKSTLALAAHGVGASVLSDEYTLIDPATGLASGWSRPLRRRNPDGTTDRLDILGLSPPIPVGLVAAVHYAPLPNPGWQMISPAVAAVELLNHTICARTRPQDALDGIMMVVRSAIAVAGPRDGATDSILRLIDLLDRRPSD